MPVRPTRSMLRTLFAQAVRCCESPAFAKPLRNAVALFFADALADDDFVVGRARAGVSAENDDLVDAVVRSLRQRGVRRRGKAGD